MTWLRAAHCLGALIGIQALFAVVIAILASTSLTGSDGACYLNLSGDTCDFVAITSYFSLFFGLLSSLGVFSTLRAGPATFLPPVVASLQAFGSLWWLAAAITATQRGKQAASAGMPQGSARDGVIALSWLEFVLYLAAIAVVAYDMVARKRHSVPIDRTTPMLADVESPATESLTEFKKAAYEAPHAA